MRYENGDVIVETVAEADAAIARLDEDWGEGGPTSDVRRSTPYKQTSERQTSDVNEWVPDEQIDALVATLRDNRPFRATYAKIVRKLGYAVAMSKACELAGNSKFRIPAAVFIKWGGR